MSSKEYLSFTKRERAGILTLVAILILVAIVPHFMPKPKPSAETVPVTQLESRNRYADSSRFRADDSTRTEYYERKPWNNSRYHRNYYPDSSYRKRYRSNDNYYRNNYGEGKPHFHNDEQKMYRNYARDYASYHKPRYQAVDINAADTSALIALPGIGSKLAARIVSFREKLGGFNSVNQIREVYGLRDSVFLMLLPYLKCDSVYVRKPLLSYNTLR